MPWSEYGPRNQKDAAHRSTVRFADNLRCSRRRGRYKDGASNVSHFARLQSKRSPRTRREQGICRRRIESPATLTNRVLTYFNIPILLCENGLAYHHRYHKRHRVRKPLRPKLGPLFDFRPEPGLIDVGIFRR